MLGKRFEELKKWNWSVEAGGKIAVSTRKWLLELWLYDLCLPVVLCTGFSGREKQTIGSTLSNFKFSECCSSGNVTSHFLIISACE